MRVRLKSIAAIFFVIFSCAIATDASAGDIAIVKATQYAQKQPHQKKTIGHFCQDIARRLAEYNLDYEILTDEQVISGALDQYHLAIFPFNSISDARETDKILPQIMQFPFSNGVRYQICKK